MFQLPGFFVVFSMLFTGTFAHTLDGIEASLTISSFSRKAETKAAEEIPSCEFNTRSCAYSSLSGVWKNISGSVQDTRPWVKIFGTDKTPDLPLIGAELNSDQPFATLTSDPIKCANERGSEVVFNFWSSRKVELQVCFVKVSSGSSIACSEKFTSNSAGYPVDYLSYKYKQPISEPFRIEYMAMSDEPENRGVLLLDNLSYFGRVCDENSNLNPNPPIRHDDDDNNDEEYNDESATKKTTPWMNIPNQSRTVGYGQKDSNQNDQNDNRQSRDKNICRVSQCNFDDDDCDFTAREGGVAWARSDDKLSNNVLSQANDLGAGSFLQDLVNSFQPGCVGSACQLFSDTSAGEGHHMEVTLEPSMFQYEVAVLTSPLFKPVGLGVELRFNYFRSRLGQTIRVCFEQRENQYEDISTLKSCSAEIPEYNLLTDANWRPFSVDIPANTYRIHIVAHLKLHIWFNAPIAIDNISVTPC